MFLLVRAHPGFPRQIPQSRKTVVLCVWLDGRNGIWPVKKLSGGMLAWMCVYVKVQICIWPS